MTRYTTELIPTPAPPPAADAPRRLTYRERVEALESELRGAEPGTMYAEPDYRTGYRHALGDSAAIAAEADAELAAVRAERDQALSWVASYRNQLGIDSEDEHPDWLARAKAAEAERDALQGRIDALTHPANDMTGRAYEAGRSDSEKSLADMDEEMRALQDAMPDPALIEQFVEWAQGWAPSYGWTDEVGDMASRLYNAAAAIRAALATEQEADR